MANWYEQVIASFGHGLCHQLPERSFFAAGIQFPVCSRCTGIYVGFIFVLAALIWMHRGAHPSGRVDRRFYLLVALGILAMAWDGVTSYSGLRVTSNLLRLVTGSLFGGSLALVVYAMMADVLLSNVRTDRSLAPARTVAAWFAAVSASVVAVYLLLPMVGVLAPAVIAVMVVATFASVGTAAVGLSRRFRRSVADFRSAAGPTTLGTVVGVATIGLAKLLQAGLDRLVDLLLV